MQLIRNMIRKLLNNKGHAFEQRKLNKPTKKMRGKKLNRII